MIILVKRSSKGWNCISSNKSNAYDIIKWRWQPNEILKQVSKEVKKWRPAGSDRGYTFMGYNLTNLLDIKEGFYRVDVDVPEGTWAEAPSYVESYISNDCKFLKQCFNLCLISSTVIFRWWAPSSSINKSPYFLEKITCGTLPGDQILPYTIPRHFEGGDWDQGGSCQRVKPISADKAEELFSLENNGTNVETRLVNQHLYRALKTSSFQVLDITGLSELRADAHPSTAGGKKHVDCMHWCLPGITDTWNDLLMAYLTDI
ncbi:hypothetical protein MKW92_040651 [Papaver armeniacum]|nr:hypothetical protein MKW92_040651 [Papaver armeniacum]